MMSEENRSQPQPGGESQQPSEGDASQDQQQPAVEDGLPNDPQGSPPPMPEPAPPAQEETPPPASQTPVEPAQAQAAPAEAEPAAPPEPADASAPVQEAAPVEQPPPPPPHDPAVPRTEYWVRHGAMLLMARFSSTLMDLRCGTKVIMLTERGMEVGEIVGSCEQYGCDLTSQDVDSRIENAPKSAGHSHDHGHGHANEILRAASAEDLREVVRIEEGAHREREFCARLIGEQNLPMKLVEVEHLFGGGRIVFYFLADGRVDFRQLVRDLAKEYQTRIEMRQIGVRDEARLLADYERCGQRCCCRQYLKALSPVNMRMAKVQKATLDPAKISGRCGRLMCCLRYEDQTYADLKKRLPRRGTRTLTPEGPGVVIGGQIITQLVPVGLDVGRREVFALEDLSFDDVPPPPEQRIETGGRPGGRPSGRDRRPGGESGRPGGGEPAGEGDGAAPRSKRRRRRGRRRSGAPDAGGQQGPSTG